MSTLKKYNGKCGKVIIPDSIDVIGARAFTNRPDINNVAIPDSVTVIEAGAFDGCPNIRVTYKGQAYTAENINQLYFGCEDFEIIDSRPEYFSVSKDGILTGYNDGKKGGIVEIPEGVVRILGRGEGGTSFYAGPFTDHNTITRVIMPNSLTTIDSLAFDQCGSLKRVDIPNSVTYIGDRAFWRCRDDLSVTYKGKIYIYGSNIDALYALFK